jgi:hypothetical protein
MLHNAASGYNAVPSTRAEYEALRVAGGDGPAENPGNGSNNLQVVTGIHNRYHWTPLMAGPPTAPHPTWGTILGKLRNPGDGAALQGSMGAFSLLSHWRRWDRQFAGPHSVYVQRLDLEDRLWWMNPQAPNTYAGEFISLKDAAAYYMAFNGGAVFVRMGMLNVDKPPAAIGPKPQGATMWVRTNDLDKLWTVHDGVARPTYAPPGPAFTFDAWAGPNVSLVWAPGPKARTKGGAVFRRVYGPAHAGMYIRVSDAGSVWHHNI